MFKRIPEYGSGLAVDAFCVESMVNGLHSLLFGSVAKQPEAANRDGTN